MKLQGKKKKNDWRGTWLVVRKDRVSLVQSETQQRANVKYNIKGNYNIR